MGLLSLSLFLLFSFGGQDPQNRGLIGVPIYILNLRARGGLGNLLVVVDDFEEYIDSRKKNVHTSKSTKKNPNIFPMYMNKCSCFIFPLVYTRTPVCRKGIGAS